MSCADAAGPIPDRHTLQSKDRTMSTLDTRTPSATIGRTLHRTLWVLQVLVAAFFVVAAAGPKLLGDAYAVEMFSQIGAGQWFRYVIGVLELAGAVGLLVPRLAGPAALGLTGLMIGAIGTQIVVLGSPIMALTPAFLGVLVGTIAWFRLREGLGARAAASPSDR